MAPGTNVTKLFTTVIYECFYETKVFVLGNPFQHSLMFAGKARSLLKSGTPEKGLY
jgi:hypothetical protein